MAPVVALALVAAALGACGGTDDSTVRGGTERADDSGATTTVPASDGTAPTSSSPLPVPAESRLATVEGVDFPDALALTEGTAWVLQVEQDDRGAKQWVEVMRIDAATHTVADRLEIESLEGDFYGAAITAGAGAVWVATTICNGERPTLLFRIDPTTVEVAAPIELGEQAWCDDVQVVAGSGKVWVGGTRHDQTGAFVQEVDAAGLRPGTSREIPGPTVELGAARLLTVGDRVWVSYGEETVVHAAGDWSEAARLPHETSSVVEYEGAVWTGAGDGVHRYEGDPPVQVAVVELPDPAPGHAQEAEALAANADGLWVQGLVPWGPTALHEIDPADNSVGPDLLPDKYRLLGADAGGLWLNGYSLDAPLVHGMPSPAGRIEGPYAVVGVGYPAEVALAPDGRVWYVEPGSGGEGPWLRRVSGDPPAIDLEVDFGGRAPLATAAAAGRVWALTVNPAPEVNLPPSGPAHLVEIDPDTGAVLDDRALGDDTPFGEHGPPALVATSDALWLQVRKGGGADLWQLDPATAEVTTRIELSPSSTVSTDGDDVYVIDTAAIRRVDPATSELVDVAELEMYDENGSASGGWLWVTRNDLDAIGEPGELRRVDPATGETVATYVLPDATTGSVAATDHFAWVAGTRVSLVDLESGDVRSIQSSFVDSWSPFAADDEGAWFVGFTRSGATGLARATLPADLAPG